MTESVAAPPPVLPALRPYWRAIVPLALLVAAALWLRPNFSLLAPISPATKIHLAAAVVALGLGAVMMASRKGRRFHRTAGWIWVTIMAVLAVSSLFITGLNGSSWSWIHVLSFLTLASLPIGVWAARGHKVRIHSRTMMGMFYGGLVMAGLFTFVPGRLMFQVFFGG